MANNNNVSAGKPLVAGAIYRALITEDLVIPEDATSELSEDFVSLGFISDGGLEADMSRSSDDYRDWSGSVIYTAEKEKNDTFKYECVEHLNIEVLKMIYGDDNVTGTVETGITIKSNAKELSKACYVIDMILTGDIIKRVVIPSGKISEIGSIVYKSDDIIRHEITVSALACDDEGNTHFEYLKKKA